MYREKLLLNKYFSELAEEESFNNILDSLTKVVSRKYIVKYMEYLIAENKPFAMAIIDIDNFKLINDYYGHVVGDQTLETIGASLIKYVGDDGIVGRYGGDEFVVVYEKATDYDSVHTFLAGIYRNDSVLRKTIDLENVSIFITGTSGSASYPKDANNYEELFEKADKALYRGKSKGRNCFIVFVYEKHKDIDISKFVKEPMHLVLDNLSNIMDNQPSVENGTQAMLRYLNTHLNNTCAEHFDNDFKPIAKDCILTTRKCGLSGEIISNLLNRVGMFYSNDLEYIKSQSEELYKFCKYNNILSILIYRIKLKELYFGYLVLTESKIQRLWQEEDKELLVYIGKIVGLNSLIK